MKVWVLIQEEAELDADVEGEHITVIGRFVLGVFADEHTARARQETYSRELSVEEWEVEGFPETVRQA